MIIVVEILSIKIVLKLVLMKNEKKQKYYENKEAAEAEASKTASWILKGQEEDAKKKY